jgi:hypothetical protein
LASYDSERPWPNRDIILAFEGPRETPETFVRIAGAPAEIRTMHPQNISLDSYCYINPPGSVFMGVKLGKAGTYIYIYSFRIFEQAYKVLR